MTRTARSESLLHWLEARNARPLATGKLGNRTLESFAVNGQLVIVMEQPDGSEWDLLCPVSLMNSIEATLNAADRACGLSAEDTLGSPLSETGVPHELAARPGIRLRSGG